MIQKGLGKMRKETENRALKIYQGVVLIVAAAIIALIPSVMIWKLHIMSLQDASVVIGIIFCYAFAAAAAIAGCFFIRKTIGQKKEKAKEASMRLQHS